MQETCTFNVIESQPSWISNLHLAVVHTSGSGTYIPKWDWLLLKKLTSLGTLVCWLIMSMTGDPISKLCLPGERKKMQRTNCSTHEIIATP